MSFRAAMVFAVWVDRNRSEWTMKLRSTGAKYSARTWASRCPSASRLTSRSPRKQSFEFKIVVPCLTTYKIKDLAIVDLVGSEQGFSRNTCGEWSCLVHFHTGPEIHFFSH